MVVLSWLVLGGFVGLWIATTRGFSKTRGVLGGICLGPFLGLFMLLIASDRKCPHCAEGVKPNARVCRHCGRDLTPAGPPKASLVW